MQRRAEFGSNAGGGDHREFDAGIRLEAGARYGPARGQVDLELLHLDHQGGVEVVLPKTPAVHRNAEETDLAHYRADRFDHRLLDRLAGGERIAHETAHRAIERVVNHDLIWHTGGVHKEAESSRQRSGGRWDGVRGQVLDDDGIATRRARDSDETEGGEWPHLTPGGERRAARSGRRAPES